MSRPQDAIPQLSRRESVEVAQKDGESSSGEALPEGWAMSPIEDFAKTATGGTPSRKRDDYYGGDIAWVKSGDLNDGLVTEVDERITQLGLDESNAKMFPKGAVCIALYGATVGKLGVLDMDASTNQAVCGIFPEDGIETQFVFHALRNERASLIGKAQGGAQPNISNGIIKKTELRVAPSDEQSRIVSAIESLQERSSRARVLLSEVGPLIGQLRQSVLRDAFSGKLTADWRARRRMGTPESPSPPAPSEENSGLGAPVKDSATNPAQETASELLLRIRTERRERWQSEQLAKYEAKGKQPPKNWQDKYKEPEPVDESELPELPDGWCWGVMEELCSNIVDCPHSTPKWTESGKLCVRTTEFRAGRLVLTNAKFVSDETFEKRISRLKPAPGDVLYSREGGILGLACQIPPEVELCLGQRMMLMRSEKGIDATLMMHWLNSPFIFNDRVQAKIQGAASPHVNVGEVKRFPIPVPPVEEQQALRSLIEEALATVESVSTGRASMESSLTQLDQSILSKAFRGELVPQDPRDEPASDFLARIRTTRETTATEKKTIKKKAPRKKKAEA